MTRRTPVRPRSRRERRNSLLGIRLAVRRIAGARCVLHSADGDLLLDDLELNVGRTSSDTADGNAEVSAS
ncbi:hypothetical protein GCM10010365_64880 [Streptomyces poonensis]|uniref:Uncharacterized protein n=1 Tax=Streptomyces poonensis TaxID=68255 RepID=A0A918UUJ7_9ACTN|nr:hypothetical protein GCM10010365_64880 [Streptomyces poonensis]